MKPAAFEYFAPSSMQEALVLLGEFKDEAKILAGGQSLMPLLNMRLARPQALIDINRIASHSYIRQENGALTLGALTRHREIETSPLVRGKCPILAEAAGWIGYPQIRNRGTIGGSLAHAHPAAELPAVVTALRGEIGIVGRTGERTVKAEEFFQGFFTVALEPNEILSAVRLPLWPESAGFSFKEFNRRHGDFAIAGVAALVSLNGKKECEASSIVLAGVNPTPLRAQRSETLLKGRKITREIIETAATLAAEDSDPPSDVHGSADYRRELVKVITRRALEEAVKRAK